MINLHLTTLGCDKNTVDSQLMLGILAKKYAIENDPSKAEIIIINTCCFIQEAKEESIDYIFDYLQYKKTGCCKMLIVSGCMAERYTDELKKEIPEIDGFLGVGNIENIDQLITNLEKDKSNAVITGNIDANYAEDIQRYIPPGSNTAYLKVSEGCNHHCTYCVIPKIRGKYRSRQPEDILNEALYLQKNGISELILIAQDLAPYGSDLNRNFNLSLLLKLLAEKTTFTWIRMLYLYPEGITEELLYTISKYDNICQYFDVPIQHTEDIILKSMGREQTNKSLFEKINFIREKLPLSVIRTTIITGFPGETEENHKNLLLSLNKLKFDRLGVFSFSKEEGTPAAKFPNQISLEKAESRKAEIYFQQEEITQNQNARFLGKSLLVLVEEILDVNTYLGRFYGDSPDIDCNVIINSEDRLLLGKYYYVKIRSTEDYDLIGEINNEFAK